MAILGLILVALAGLRPIGLDGDSPHFAVLITSVRDHFNLIEKEPTFWLIYLINRAISPGDVSVFFTLYALLGVFVKFIAIDRMAEYPRLSVVLYLFLYYILHEMTQFRAGVAAGFLLLMIYALRERKKSALLYYIAAILFHYSAIVAGVLLLVRKTSFNKRTYLFIVIMSFLAGLFLSSRVLVSTVIPLLPDIFSAKLVTYLTLLDQGHHAEMNVFNFYYTSLLAFFIMITLSVKSFVGRYDALLMKSYAFSLSFFYLFSAVPVLAFRLSELFGAALIVLLPNCARYFKQKDVYLFILFMWAVTYFVFIGLMRNMDFSVISI